MLSRYLLSGCLLWLATGACAQQPPVTVNARESGPPKPHIVDASDVIADFLGWKRRSADSAAAHFSVIPSVGYTELTGFSGGLTGIYSFRHRDPGAEQKLSSILGGVTLAEKGQLTIPLNAIVFSRHNNWNILFDGRYMRTTAFEWGLGTHTGEAGRYRVDYDYLKLHGSVLRRLSGHLYAGLGYYYDRLWDVAERDLPVGTVTDYQRYGLAKRSTAAGPALRFIYDSRLNPINPGSGWYAGATLRVNRTELRSDSNWQSLLLELRHYIPVGAGTRSVLAFWSYNWLTLGPGSPPYLLLPSTGWDDFFNTGRGFLQGRHRGRNLLYLEAEYRTTLTRNGLLGAVLFANAQTYPSEPFDRNPRVLPGAGAGLRIKLDKYSATNIALDFGFGPGGTGIVALNIGEVF
ncbi:MAG: hypothetical protein EOO12_08805 [Chitinophagaceae bacterium]|nr:MAG: hypothetical protein EOO12_08805 [Chitinophagaceae bacterium]